LFFLTNDGSNKLNISVCSATYLIVRVKICEYHAAFSARRQRKM
jgi:hypothetical protein